MATDLWSGFYGALGGFLSAPVVMLYQTELQDLKSQVADLEKLLEDIDLQAALLLSASDGVSVSTDAPTLIMMAHRRMHMKLAALEERGMAHERVEMARRNLDALWEFVTDDTFASDDLNVANEHRTRLKNLTPTVLKDVRPHALDPAFLIKYRLVEAIRRVCNWPTARRRR